MIYKSYLLEQNLSLVNESLLLFYGDNYGLKKEFKYSLKNLNKNNNIFNFFQDELLKNKDLLLEQINNVSLFEDKKVFFIEDVNDKILEIVENLNLNLVSRKIYLFANTLDKKSKLRKFFETSEKCGICACYPDNDLSIKKIILRELKGFKGLSSYNINLMIDNCNLDRFKLKNEIEKVKLFFADKEINTEKLEILLNYKTNDDFDILKDLVLLGKKQSANKLLSDTSLENEKIIFYLNTLNQRLIKLSEINEKLGQKNLEQTLKEIKPPIFWKDKPNIIAQLKIWNKERISKILAMTYDNEKKLKKNTNINKNILIKKLLIDICAEANV